MKEFIHQYWWAPAALIATLMLLSCATMIINIPILDTIVDLMLDLALIAALVSWVILLIDKQGKKCLHSFLLTVLAGCLLSIPVGFISLYAPSSDPFGRRHKIPEGLDYNIPLEKEQARTVSVDSLDTDTYLQIWNGAQGGIYEYDFYYGPLPAGEIYLRCYEVTKNISLSASRLRKSSKVAVGSTSSFTRLVNKQEFSLYEGDWGDYYAARVEVWHKDARSGQETKLMEKVYRVEGWMR